MFLSIKFKIKNNDHHIIINRSKINNNLQQKNDLKYSIIIGVDKLYKKISQKYL